jgi:SCY1-like protein 1
MATLRIVRDQASKTLDIYIQRVKRYSQSLPESALPPSSASGSSQKNAPRIGTTQTDTSWAGWAISSFTNKLTAASGEIQSGKSSQSRPSSEPPPTHSMFEKPAALAKPGLSLGKNSNPADQILSKELSSGHLDAFGEDDDFGAEWGGFDEEAKSASTLVSPTSSKPFDD